MGRNTPKSRYHTLRLPSGTPLAISLRRSARARLISLRVLETPGAVELVLPRRATIAEGIAFAEEKAIWIEGKLGDLPPRVPFADGAIVPVLGEAVTLRHAPSGAKRPARYNGSLYVSGDTATMPQAVRRWLVDQARHAIHDRAHAMADEIGRPITRIGIRDPETRWGSCSSTGALSFSWRLILAPVPVLDYVVAHEVSHLVALNHGPKFWSTVKGLVGDPREPRAWLRDHGTQLRRYG